MSGLMYISFIIKKTQKHKLYLNKFFPIDLSKESNNNNLIKNLIQYLYTIFLKRYYELLDCTAMQNRLAMASLEG